MKTTGLILLLSCWMLKVASGQDGHYSQFQNSPLYLNPAQTGGGPEDTRIGVSYRTQWSSLHSPYLNYGAFADTKKGIFGLGLQLNQSQAGPGSLKYGQLGLSLAIHKKLADGNNNLSAGLQLGLLQQRFDPGLLSFDAQYSPGVGYDPGLGSLETFENRSLLLPDLGVGLNWQFNILEDGPLSGDFGIAFHHLNQPNSSFFEDNVRIPLKTSFYGLLNFQVAAQLDLAPRILYMRQLEAQQMVVGIDLVYQMNPLSTLRLGVGNRINDALLFYVGLDLDRISFGFSFDNKMTEFKPVPGQVNALEFTAVYKIGQRVQREKPKPLFDTDGDGVLDRADKCPEIPGLKSNRGCPLKEKEDQTLDFDGDGVNDDNDLCPYAFGEIRYQGCLDRDGDGVWDHVDACPAIAGHPNNYGCPIDQHEVDSDADGIINKEDKCIYVKGEKEFFGCPDSDGDRIPDLYDQCPYLSGVPALGGCPKQGDSATRSEINRMVIEFATDKFEIRDNYFAMLDRVVLELRFNDDYQVVLEGHTDSEGDEAYNYYLSQRRAASIKRYLVSKGVGKERISAFFYGESKPLSSNRDPAGKARNRRTEIILFR